MLSNHASKGMPSHKKPFAKHVVTVALFGLLFEKKEVIRYRYCKINRT